MNNYIIFDLEWNQCPRGKENSIEALPFEIIEIGAVKLDKRLCLISEFHRLISPKVYKEMHFKISEVTHMNMEELKRTGEDFKDAVAEFIEWCGTDYTFCTWGPMDLTELQRNMSYFHFPIPFQKPLLYYDVQKLYALLHDNMAAKPSLDTATEQLGIMENRPFHRALDDAYYTGKVMQAIDFKTVEPYISVDYYRLPEIKEEEIYLEFPTYIKYVSRIFDTKEDALADKTVTDMFCLTCGRMLRKKVRWFSFNQRVYFCLGVCPEHGYVRGKIRMKRIDDGRVYAVKTMKTIDEEGALKIFERKDELKKRRNEKTRLKRAQKKKVSSIS